MRRYLIVGAALTLAGCTSSGPFVTSISSDGQGGLNVISCMSTYDAATGTQGNGQCSNSHVQVVPPRPITPLNSGTEAYPSPAP